MALKPAGKQEPYKKVGQHPMPASNKTKLRKYGSTSFAGRPLQTSTKPAPKTGSKVLGY